MKDTADSVLDDDRQDVELSRKGDLDAFERLVVRHQKGMLNISLRMVGSHEDALEVVQDSFVSAYRNIRDFDGRSKFRTWLCAIVMNMSRNRIEQMKSRSQREGSSIHDPVEGVDGSMTREFADPEMAADRKMEQAERQAVVWRCIKALEEEFRAIVVLRDIQGYSYAEIGSVLRIPDGTVKSRLFRARDDLRDCLKRLLGI